MKIERKVFVVTGGGNGIGREVVLGLLTRGARVAIVDRRTDDILETIRLAGAGAERVSSHIVDVTDEAVAVDGHHRTDRHGGAGGGVAARHEQQDRHGHPCPPGSWACCPRRHWRSVQPCQLSGAWAASPGSICCQPGMSSRPRGEG